MWLHSSTTPTLCPCLFLLPHTSKAVATSASWILPRRCCATLRELGRSHSYSFFVQASPVQWLVLALSCAVGHCLSVAGLNVQVTRNVVTSAC